MLSNLHIIYTIRFFLLYYFYIMVNGELFSAIVEIEYLLKTQKRLIDNLDFYLHKEEKRLACMKKYLDEFKTEQKKAIKDVDTYLSNPINLFTVIKRLLIDLNHLEEYTVIKAEFIRNVTLTDKKLVYPTQADLRGTAEAIARLQNTYKLHVKELAAGKLNGVVYSTPMTSGDCYEIGRLLHKDADYVHVCAWMIEAFHKYYKEKIDYHFTAVDIVEYIIFAYFSLNDMENALKWTYTLLDMDPKNSRAKQNIPLYYKAITLKKSNVEKELNKESRREPDIEVYANIQKTYEAQCRGERVIPIDMRVYRRLTCRYSSENNAFLKIAPLKMEIANINPDVILFRNVLSTNEIEALKEIATLKFKRISIPSQEHEITSALAKTYWLKDTEIDIAARISRRVADMTGLNVESAEPLQVINYGVGGHYELHYDTPPSDHTDCTKYDRNRIATVMFYMSDVPLGGATVFTKLGLNVYPVKGTAVFWYNMHPSGERNNVMIHAGCPVLLGSKWVCNKYIHHCGQELIKPCNLVRQRE